MFLNKDYDDFVQRMGSFDQEIDINDEEDETSVNKSQDRVQQIINNIGDYRINYRGDVMKRLDDILAHAWNVFSNRSPTKNQNGYIEQTSSNRLDKTYYYRNANSTIAIPVFNRIAMDVAGISIRHVKEDEEGKFVSYVKDGLDRCLNVEANIDQSGSAFIQDIVMSMFDEGCVAVAPIDTDISSEYTSGYDILSMIV